MDKANIGGFINIDKPSDWTSHDVVAKLRRVLGIKKIGHTGTLDPFATGVLPIAIGSATRLIRFLKKSKRYIAGVDFSSLTDTDDLTGEVLDTSATQDVFAQLKLSPPDKEWTEESLKEALKNFQGKFEQVPPLYSAIHHKGKKLYELMRAGEDISLDEINKRTVNVSEIKLLEFNYPYAKIDITCSEGTYIRSIARDLGGHLSSLQRTESNGFDLESTVTIPELEEILSSKPEALEEFLVMSYEVVDLPLMEFNNQEALDLQQGKRIIMNLNSEDIESLANSEFIQCIDETQELIGIGTVHKRRGDSLLVQPKVVL